MIYMEGNEFVQTQKREQEQAQANAVNFLVQEIKKIVVIVNDLKKDNRTIREELRKLQDKKLRPLRVSGEEAEVIENENSAATPEVNQ